jgi:hypothetical protein
MFVDPRRDDQRAQARDQESRDHICARSREKRLGMPQLPAAPPSHPPVCFGYPPREGSCAALVWTSLECAVPCLIEGGGNTLGNFLGSSIGKLRDA